MSDLDTRIMEQLKKATREQKLQVLEWLNEVVGPANKAPTIFKQKEDKGVFNITELADDGFSSDTDGDGVEDDKNTEDLDDDEIEESIEEEDDTDYDIEDDEESDEIDDDEIDDVDLEDDDDDDDEEPVKKGKTVKAKKKVDDEDFETEDDEEEESEDEEDEDPDDDTTDDEESEDEDPDDDTTDDGDDDDEEPVKKKSKQVKAKKVKFDEDDYDTWTADTIKQVKAYIKKTWGVNPNQFKGKDEKVVDQLIDVDDDILTQQEKWEKMKLNKLEALCKKEGIKIKGRTEKAKKDNAVEQLTANYVEENY